jgi:hypothetical protein
MVILQKLFFLSVFPKVENLCLSTGTCSRPFVFNNFNPTIYDVRWYFRQLYLPKTTLTLIRRIIFYHWGGKQWMFWKQILFVFRDKEKRLLVSPNPARSILSNARHFGIGTIRHQDTSAPVWDISAPRQFGTRTIRHLCFFLWFYVRNFQYVKRYLLERGISVVDSALLLCYISFMPEWI